MDAFRRAFTLALGLLLARSEAPPTESAECEAAPKGRSLLQVPPQVKKTAVSELVVEQEEAVASPSPAGTVNWDGYRTFEVKRKEMDSFPAEMLFRVPLSELGPHNATHIFFPYVKMLSVTFVRDMHGIGSYEYGYAKWLWNVNELSAVGEDVVVGAAEKLHTLSHEGAWSDASLQHVRRVQAGRWGATDSLAKSMRLMRSAGVNAWAILNKVGSQMMNASLDHNVMADLKAFAREPGLGPVGARMAAVSANLTEKHDAYVAQLRGSPKATSTACNCFHLHAAPGLTLTPDGFWWPLNRKLTSVRGETVFVPLQRFDIVTGIAVATIKDGMLEVYQGASTISSILDPSVQSDDRRKAPQLFVGPTDGADRPIPPDGRWQPVPHSTTGAGLTWSVYNAWHSLPADFTYLSEPPEVICPVTHLQAIMVELAGLDLQAMAGSSASTTSKMNAVRIMTNMLDCAGDFLRGDMEASHAYGPIESLVFLHAMLEFPQSTLMRGWNNIPGEMFCPPSGCVATTTTTTTTTTIDAPSWWLW